MEYLACAKLRILFILPGNVDIILQIKLVSRYYIISEKHGCLAVLVLFLDIFHVHIGQHDHSIIDYLRNVGLLEFALFGNPFQYLDFVCEELRVLR